MLLKINKYKFLLRNGRKIMSKIQYRSVSKMEWVVVASSKEVEN